MKKVIQMHIKVRWLVCLFCMVLFSILLKEVSERGILKTDEVVYKFISTYFIRDNTISVAKAVTWFGSFWAVIFVTFLIVIFSKNWKLGIIIIINAVITSILNRILKNIIERPRPNGFRLIEESGYSFPSAHAMTSFAFYGLLIFIIYKVVKTLWLQRLSTIILSLIIISVGMSRVFLGVHYTSDVLAGYLVSLTHLIIFISLIEKLGDNIPY